MTKSNLGRKGLISSYSFSHSITAGGQGRDLSRSHGGVKFTGLFLMVSYMPRDHRARGIPPTIGWALPPTSITDVKNTRTDLPLPPSQDSL